MTVMDFRKELKTRKAIDALPLGQHRDRETKGFGILVRTDSDEIVRRVFNVQSRVRGSTKQRKWTIGDTALITIAQAREQAEKWLAQIKLGHDPAAEKEAARAAASVMKFLPGAELFLAKKAEKLRPNSLRMAKMFLTSEHYFPKFHRKPLDQITRGDICRRLDELKSESASRAYAVLNGYFKWCLMRGYCSQNPMIGIESYKQGPARDRVLDDAELRSVWNACQDDDDFGKIVKLLILTGCRCNEIGGLKWSEVDLNAGTITIPGTRTKNHRAHTLQLPPLALDIIRSIPQRVGDDHVFGQRGNGFGSWNYAKSMLKDDIKKEWRLHDLRRSCATGMADIGIMPHIIEAVLNHASGHKGGVAGIYNRSKYADEMKSALLRWADHIANIVDGTKSNVIQLRAG
jgi:integrase